MGNGNYRGIPCTHVVVVFKELRYQQCYVWVSSYFIMQTYRLTYEKVAFHVPVPTEYEEPDEVMVVLPPLMDKTQARRPKNHNRIASKVKVRFGKYVVVAKGSVTQAETLTLRFP
ncbi:unnamed protein product [Lactuca saligna]|uniref:Uncharacterized protein n=1 Tax=Lactuca saligna TaxID=75948 RepID=A0AA35Z0H3_LACSI|nr:unnamed protein product [Lactuca saligna]